MKFQILGTAAAEGWPALFCACDTCRRARASGGKDLRSRASLMVNDIIKVDLNADTYHHLVTHGLDFSRIEHILFTHSHNDHFSPGELEYLRDPFAHKRTRPVVDVWCSRDVAELIREAYPDTERLGISVHEVVPFRTVELGDVSVTPIVAYHRAEELCLNWIFGDLDRAVLYASDTGPYREPTWEFLAGVKFDLVISECTGGFLPDMETHLTVNTVRRMREQLDRMGSLNPGCRFVLTHFSHNMGMLHDEFQEKVREDGFLVAYDGIVLETQD
ncbi:MAG: hypothetical protein KatS3mg024_1179 [Armatimonadota bacterium]|nr:MAG: hypothetical protein KatS3mg024_1179 [Armatimonadota bacterium]